MSDTTQHEPSLDAQTLVNQLMKSGMSAHTIAEKLGHRVSYRTIYRWAKGECAPHQPSDILRVAQVGLQGQGTHSQGTRLCGSLFYL